MRRAPRSSAISPQQLKHFAFASVVITGLLAVLASGEEWGASAQAEAIAAKNQLAATEAQKLGTRKVATTLKIKPRQQTMDFGDADFGGGDDGGSSLDGPVGQTFRATNVAPPPVIPLGGSVTIGNQTVGDLPPGVNAPGRKKVRGKPSAAEIEAIKQASRSRTQGGDARNTDNPD
jgi:hypothetical protein